MKRNDAHERHGRTSESGKAQGELQRALRNAVSGEVRFDSQSRGLYSMDASNFRHVPVGVVVPATVQDVVETVRTCHDHQVPVVSRGGGTGLAGQSLNVAVVIDHSKHLRAIGSIDSNRRTATVQSGVILDDLRERAQKVGLTFGPDPATHDRCTLGGMIGNNACGIHAVLSEFYGAGPRTEDNLAEMEVLTYDGLRMRVGPTSDASYREILSAGGRKAEIYRGLRELVDRRGDAIRRGFPDIARRVSGYNLPALLPENGFDVGQALVGSEGTCVTVLEATVRLCRYFPQRALLLLGYPNVFDAADDVVRVRQFKPVGLEGMDRLLISFVKQQKMHPEYTELLPEGEGWLIAEFGGDTRHEAWERARAAQRAIERPGRPPTTKVVAEEIKQEHLWKVRESGLGATAFVPGERDAWPGWEDSAVPVDQLGSYLRKLQKLYEKYDYLGSVYGHFGQGCVHKRISFDFASDEGLHRYKRFTREAAELCVEHGGSLSGEHGDGQQRSDLLPVMFGEEVMEAFRAFKTIWDPTDKMNPGRIVEPMARDANLRFGPGHGGWKPETRFAFPKDGGDFSHAALRCVGVGKCRSDDAIMCPSYMVTHDEEHTTRGRARLLHEMILGDVVKERWRSEEVKEALDLCLACKGCKRDCPVDVDMATYKAEFLSHYYEHAPRPRQAYSLGWIHRWVRLGSAVPRLANLAATSPGFAAVAKRVAGIASERDVPRFATRSFRRSFRPKERGEGRRVILWTDCFNNAFFPETLEAAVQVLEHAGCRVAIPRKKLCCGRALYDYGMLDIVDHLLRETMDTLAEDIDAGTPVVGVEPSCIASFRDELPNLFPEDERASKLSRQTFTLAEFLLHQVEGYEPPRFRAKAIFHGHCHHKSVMGIEDEHVLLARMGVDFAVPEPSCCGMAGSFGFEQEKYEVSRAVGERHLLPAVRSAAEDTLIIADGYSCREQISQLGGRRALHVGEVMQMALQGRSSLQGETNEPRRAASRTMSGAARLLALGSAAAVAGALLAWLAYALW